MTLKEYMIENKISIEDLAEKIDEPHHRNVYRYMRTDEKGVIPRADKMELIWKITKGEVTPNDFYPFLGQ
jgi:hypothetical protein